MTEAEQDTFNPRFSNFFDDLYTENGAGTPMSLIAAKVSRTTSQAKVANDTLVLFNSEIYDYDNMVDLVANNDRITIQTSGLYLINGTVDFEFTGLQTKKCEVWITGVKQHETVLVLTNDSIIECNLHIELEQENYVQLYFGNTGTVGIKSASLSVARLGESI